MRTIYGLMFPNFEMLDMFGPLEMFGMLSEQFDVQMIAETSGPVACTQGPRTVVDSTLEDATRCDLLLIPGGAGTRREIDNSTLIDWIARVSQSAEITMSVCTGSVLLARAGILYGRKATTNKLAFNWVKAQAPSVQWISQARWVQDGNVFTSSGVSAGIDMSLAVISSLCGSETAKQVCAWAEYQWNDNPDCDPFAWMARPANTYICVSAAIEHSRHLLSGLLGLLSSRSSFPFEQPDCRKSRDPGTDKLRQHETWSVNRTNSGERIGKGAGDRNRRICETG